MMASMLASGNDNVSSVNLRGVDPETCMIVFKNHWAQVAKILEKHDPLRSGGSGVGLLGGGALTTGSRFVPIPGDEASAVQNYVEHMLLLLMEEDCGQEGAMGPILEFVVTENVMEQLFLWSLRRQFTDEMKVEQLKMYEMLVGQSRQPILHHKPVLRPLMMLLGSCSGARALAVETELVLLLNQLCSILVKDPSILELFFHTSEDQGAANFLIFSLLIPFIHREGLVGQQARDALMLIMALSAENQSVADHIVHNTYFCPVLATGLSGLYSSLPTRLEVQSEEWHCLQREDWQQVPTLVQFLNSLDFCSAVIQVAHPTIKDQLVGYIYNGFLVPVLAPALHKLTIEEVMTTTAYLDLFLRSVREPALLQTLLSFILMHQYEKVHILDTLVSRINTPFQLGTVSLALFRTLIGLHCEDVMLQLILRYLIPCNHMMLSQRWVVRERDCYSVSAAKLLSLTPSCCSAEPMPPPLRQQLDCILWSKVTDRPQPEMGGSLSEVGGAERSRIIGSELVMDISYVQYLSDARRRITLSIQACRVWSAPYDGENPSPVPYHPSVLAQEPGKLKMNHPHPRMPRQSRQSVDLGPGEERANQPELEWDNSYDTALSPDKGDEDDCQTPTPVPDEPPPHIQEMKKNATLLIKGSYVEESDFQDDGIVYNLVAKKDAKGVAENPQGKTGKNDRGVTSPGPDTAPNVQQEPQPETCNGLSPTPQPVTADGPSRTEDSSNGVEPKQGEDDLAAQYEELIRTLSAQSQSPAKPVPVFRSPVTPVEEEEVDFAAFSAETPETEKPISPPGSKAPAITRLHEIPFTGPFISVLLSRLGNMLENSLHTNLLLTEILALMASYPQPLLRSFLLNTNMIFQPSVRSLYQVLASVKNQIERQVAVKKDFPELLREAQYSLLSREAVQMAQDSLTDFHDGENGDWTLSTEVARNHLIPERLPKNPAANPKLTPENRNMVLATILFSEFLKELAAISQEHSILSHAPSEE